VRNFITWVAALIFAGLTGLSLEAKGELKLEFIESIDLPQVSINGQPTTIHTQGLYVSEKHYYITGRGESNPKRALFFRVTRKDPKVIELVDITPESPGLEKLDHPGGFDFDGANFWIPVSESRPHSRTAIVRFPFAPHAPLAEQQPDIAFQLEDHIGAVAWDSKNRRLLGANWDSQEIYSWSPAGRRLERKATHKFFTKKADWALAIQDFKGLPSGLLIASGIDKSPTPHPSPSNAVVEVFDLSQHDSLGSAHPDNPSNHQQPATREGMAVRGSILYLLPEDLGKNAKLLLYKMSVIR